MAARHSGTFIQKMSRQPSVGPPSAMSSPPRVGPNAVATPIVAPNSPKAACALASPGTAPAPCQDLQGIWMPAAMALQQAARRAGAVAVGARRACTLRDRAYSDRPDDEQRAARALVAEAAHRHQHQAEREHEPRHDQLQLRRAWHSSTSPIDGQRHVDLRHVEDRDRGHRDAHPERTPAGGGRERDGRRWWRGARSARRARVLAACASDSASFPGVGLRSGGWIEPRHSAVAISLDQRRIPAPLAARAAPLGKRRE